MSLYAALSSGVSGLKAYSSALGVISDNITNSNTVGYKASDTSFSTLVTEAQSVRSYSPGGVAANARTLVSQQGLLQSTASATDLSIDGRGFFVVRTEPEQGQGAIQFTRAGSFTPDAAGYLQNTAGLYLMGWELDVDGTFSNNGDISQLRPINISGLTGTAEATKTVTIRANLRSSETTFTGAYSAGDLATGVVEPQFQRNVEVFDAQGGTHTLTFSYLKTGTNEWSVEVHVSPASETTATDGLIASGQLAFNPDGSLDQASSSPALFSPLNVNWTNGAGSSAINLDLGTDGSTDGMTQFDSTSALISSSVDGAVYGNVTGVSISKEGVVTALFDNGLTRAVYQLPIATFQNPDGLVRQQGNAYGVSDRSGTYALNPPGEGGSGFVAPSTLEASTVDLANEFTKMITVQRAYSASSKVITTADEMLSELNQIKR